MISDPENTYYESGSFISINVLNTSSVLFYFYFILAGLYKFTPEFSSR